MSREIRITLPLPNQDLHPNARPHYHAKSRATKKCRYDAGLAAYAAKAKDHHGQPPFGKADVKATFYLHASRGTPDKDNLLSWCKAYFDGFADAGVITNDRELTHLPVEIEKVGTKAEQRVEFVVAGS